MMSKFISNVKEYMRINHIKQNYIALMTGWDKSKVSRVLALENKPREDEMEALADAFGKTIEFFLSDESLRQYSLATDNGVKFFAGNLNENDTQVANKLLEMLRYYDAIVNM